MRKSKVLSFLGLILSAITIFIVSWTPVNPSNESNSEITKKTDIKDHKNVNPFDILKNQASVIYKKVKLEEVGLSFDVFEKAFVGFLNLKDSNKVPQGSFILSIADFNQSSKKKRLWIIDIEKEQLLMNTWVSHGRGSGGEMATHFSNLPNSHQSSLGFYITGEVYNGKHGRSLRLDGMDRGFNSNARDRAIVLHGAAYVSPQAIKSLNRLGLSHGCPAVPVELTNQIIDLVKGKNVLYIHADSPKYQSVYLNQEKAGRRLLASINVEADSSSHVGI